MVVPATNQLTTIHKDPLQQLSYNKPSYLFISQTMTPYRTHHTHSSFRKHAHTIKTYTSDSEHALSIFTIIFTLEFMLIINYQWARWDTDVEFIHNYSTWRTPIHATYCMIPAWVCIPFLFWQIRPSFVHIVHTSLNSFATAKTMNETHCTWAYMHYVLQGMTNKKSSKDSATCTW